MANKIKFNTPESLVYVGLDCETSSDNFQTGQPIQIGISIFTEGLLKEYQSFIFHDENYVKELKNFGSNFFELIFF